MEEKCGIQLKRQRKAFLSLLLCFAMLAQPVSVFAAEAVKGVQEAAALEQEVSELLGAGSYEKGEAIVLIRTEDIPEEGILSEGEVLMTAGKAEAEQVLGKKLTGVNTADGEDGLSVLFVEQEGASTRTLIRQLLKDSRVLAAEPNYLYGLPDGEETSLLGNDGDAEPPKASPSEYWDEKAMSEEAMGSDYMNYDLTRYQWSVNRAQGDRSFTLISQEAENGASDMNLESWNRFDGENPVANASGTVVVIDDGISYEHEDLKNVMAQVPDGDIEALKEYGICSGTFGYNAIGNSDDCRAKVYYDSNGIKGTHGTHVAGIIAAEWGSTANSLGTSGVASGVKLLAVRFLGSSAENGAGSQAALLRAYTYVYRLAELDQQKAAEDRLNIRVINESFGGGSISPIQSIAQAKLGELGIIIVRAAGNDSRTMENYNDDANSLFSVPGALTVGAADVGGNPDPGYTSFGMYADLFSQGSDILSTISPDMAFSAGGYFPEAYSEADPNGHQIYFQTFRKAEKKADPAPGEEEYDYPVFEKDGKLKKYGDVYLRELDGEYLPVSADYTDAAVFDYDGNDAEKFGGALKISLVKQTSGKEENGHVNCLILGLKLGEEYLYGAEGYSFTPEGDLIIDDIDTETGGKKVFHKYHELSDKFRYFGLKWGTGETENTRLDLFPYLIRRGGNLWKTGDSVCTSEQDCPVTVNGISCADNCATVNYEKYRLFAEKKDIAYCSPISCSGYRMKKESGEDPDAYVEYWLYLQLGTEGIGKTLYLDCIGAGDQLLPYAYFDGTSMAAPSASGLAAVQYPACEQEEGFRELSPKEQALYVIERLKSNVTPRVPMTGKCQTGGLLNAKSDAQARPVITGVSVVSAAEGSLKIEGSNFGAYNENTDSVTVSARKTDGSWGGETELPVTQWNGSSKNGSVFCTKTGEMKSGYYRVTVTTAAGSCTYPAALNFEDGALFETEIALQETEVDFMRITEENRVADAVSSLLASAGKKLFLIPACSTYTSLWAYDPSGGTGKEAFERIQPSLPERFGLPQDWTTAAVCGMAQADGALWIYGGGAPEGGVTEEGKVRAGILRVDPETYSSEFFRNPEQLKDFWPRDLVSLGENSPWLVLPYWSFKNGEPGSEGYVPGNTLSLIFFHTQAKWYISSQDLTLPEGIVLTEDSDVRFAGYGNSLYAAIGTMKDGVPGYHLLKIELTFTEREETRTKKTEDREFDVSARIRLLMDMPEFGSEEEKNYLARYALTMYGDRPVMTAAHITKGADLDYDTFLWDPADGSYERYGKRFCFEPVQVPSAAVCDGSLYAIGISSLKTGAASWIMRATKLAKEEYTVTFMNGDTVLQTGKVKAGELPVYQGEVPSKAETAAASYTFCGWSPEIMPADADTVYQAVFAEAAKKYLVTFDHRGHGKLPEAQLVAAGALVTDPGNLSATDYEFRGWYADTAGTRKWDFAADRMPAQALRLYAGWVCTAEVEDDEEWYDGDDVLPDDDEPSWDGGGTDGSRGSGSSSGPGVRSNTGSSVNEEKTAVTAVVLQKNGTQTLGSSIISIPAGMMTEIDKNYLVPGCRWGKSADGSWYIEESSGRRLLSTWVLVPDSAGNRPVGNYSWYYVDKSGKMLTGWKWIRGLDRRYRCYYFNEEQGSLYGACLMGGSVNGYRLSVTGAWTGPDGKEITRE